MIAELMANAGIIRNRLKIHATIQNAKSFIAVQEEFVDSFDKYLAVCGWWPIRNHRRSHERCAPADRHFGCA